MFFKINVLKKLLKETYKNWGLTVGHTAEKETGEPEGFYIASSWWAIWFAAKTIPKEAKGAIIELCGDLPEEGEEFKALKGMGNQYEMVKEEISNLPANFKECYRGFRVTGLIRQSGKTLIRYLQDEEGSTITAVNEIIIDLIDQKATDRETGEREPVGPLAGNKTASLMYWGNDRCYLMTGTWGIGEDDESEKRFRRCLEGTKII